MPNNKREIRYRRTTKTAKTPEGRLKLEALEPRFMLSANFDLLKDVNTERAVISPEHLTNVNGTLYFTAEDGNGRQLWRSDGTADGTGVIKTFNRDASDLEISELTAIGDRLYFSAETTEVGIELWTSDGTARGTQLVVDLARPQSHSTTVPSSFPRQLTQFRDELYFIAGETFTSFYRSDGTARGTILLDIELGHRPIQITSSDNTLFVLSKFNSHSNYLSSDTDVLAAISLASHTPLVIDNSGRGAGTEIGEMTIVDGTLYYEVIHPDYGHELWRSDGTPAGTNVIKRLANYPGLQTDDVISDLTQVGSTLYFVAQTESFGREVWHSDGTPEGTKPLRDIEPGVQGSDPQNLTDVNGVLYFTVHGDDGISLWKTTPIGATRVANLPRPVLGRNDLSEFIGIGDQLYFIRNDDLYTSDGTPSGTVPITSFPRTSADPMNKPVDVDGTLFFGGETYTVGQELFKLDNGASVAEAIRIDGTPTLGSDPAELFEHNDLIYFRANQGELWRTDATPFGTWQINPRIEAQSDADVSSVQTRFGTLGDSLMFLIEHSENGGGAIWKTDGTNAGTTIVTSISNDYDTSTFEFAELNGFTFYLAHRYDGDRELWRTDGTSSGTVKVYETPASGNSFGGKLSTHNGQLYFSGNDRIFRSDGTPEGTATFAITPPYPSHFVFFHDRVVFTAAGSPDAEAWITDGTAAGTLFLAQGFTLPSEVVGDTLFSGGFQTDGTQAGTTRTDIFEFAILGEHMYFLEQTRGEGQTLWRKSLAGGLPTAVKQFSIWSGNSHPINISNINGTLYFNVADDTHGNELWTSDGTESGTRLFHEFADGTLSGAPGPIRVIHDTQVVSAYSSDYGRELWVASDNDANRWHNAERPSDVDGDTAISSVDALLVINELTDREFSSPSDGLLIGDVRSVNYLDVDNDGAISPLDALLVINELDSATSSIAKRQLAPRIVAAITARSEEGRDATSRDLRDLTFAQWHDSDDSALN